MTLDLKPVGLFILLTLLTYRLARLITLDEGPGDVLLRIRKYLGAYDYGPNGLAKTSLGRGITCPHCVGVWVAFLVALSWYGWPEFFIYWLALAGAQSFMQSLGNQ